MDIFPLVARACFILSLFVGITQLVVSRTRKTSVMQKSGWNKSEPLFCITDVARRCLLSLGPFKYGRR